MIVKRYTIRVSSGWMEWNHGMTYGITEYYLPIDDLFFNTSGGLNVFKSTDYNRMEKAQDIEDFVISDELGSQIVAYFTQKSELEKKAAVLAERILALKAPKSNESQPITENKL